MKAIRKVLASIRKADQDFNLIQQNDKILVGLSGGKDSIVLFYALTLYAKFSKCEFEMKPVILDLGFDNFDPSPLVSFCKNLGYDLLIEDSRTVYPILKANTQEGKHLPCSICSRMKKAAINAVANRLGYNKVMFAHHGDDAIETLFMNAIYGGRIATFSPKMHLEKANIEFARPLIYCREDDISRCAKEENLCVLGSFCPADKNTSREEIKQQLKSIYEKYPESKENFLSMLTNYESLDIWTNLLDYQIENTDIHLKPVLNKNETMKMMEIRNIVFLQEQKVPFEDEFDNTDQYCTCYLIYKGLNPIGVIRTRQIKAREFTFSRFCILKEYRNQGIGHSVLNYLEKKLAKEYTPLKITMHAQTRALHFYEKAGYKKIGEEFIEANIPHQSICKIIKY